MKLFKKGDKVRWEYHGRPGWRNGKRGIGVGVITKIYPPYGNVPWTCEVSNHRDGVLFEDEVKAA